MITVSHDAVDQGEAQQEADASPKAISDQGSAASPTPKTQNLIFPVTVGFWQRAIRVGTNEVALKAGMSIKVEIRTGRRSVIDYILSPLREVVSNAAHER